MGVNSTNIAITGGAHIVVSFTKRNRPRFVGRNVSKSDQKCSFEVCGWKTKRIIPSGKRLHNYGKSAF